MLPTLEAAPGQPVVRLVDDVVTSPECGMTRLTRLVVVLRHGGRLGLHNFI